MMQQQQQPQGEAATYPAKEINQIQIVAFLHNVAAAFVSEPVVRDEFFALVSWFGEGRPFCDAGAVVARAAELLGARPGLLTQFRACIGTAEAAAPDKGLAEAVAPDKGPVEAAAARPRRSKRRRPVLTTTVEDPDHVSHSDDAVIDDKREEEKGQARRTTKRAGSAANGVARGGEEEEDPRLPQAIAFGKLWKRLAGEEGLRRFLEVANDPRKDAGAIYDAARAALGPGHDGLLRDFAALFLPGKAEWEEQEEQRKRGRDAAGGDGAPSVAANKKPRAAAKDDGYTSPRKRIRTSEGGGGSGTGAAATARVQEATTSNVAKGARTGGGETDRFRALWEFATGYSVLIATMARTEELIKGLPDEPPVPDNEKVYYVDLENLFPCRDSRKFLEHMYGRQWRKIRSGLENSELTGRALRAVLGNLRWAEARAVEDAREWRDQARAAAGFKELVAKRVDEEHRRRGSNAVGDRRGA